MTAADGRTTPSRRRRFAVGALVIVPAITALAISALAGGHHPYPGVAVGSQLVLVTERAAAVWLLWLFFLVVSERAIYGRLPDELSARGVKYADASKVEELRSDFDSAIASLTTRVEVLSARDEPDDDDAAAHDAA